MNSFRRIYSLLGKLGLLLLVAVAMMSLARDVKDAQITGLSTAKVSLSPKGEVRSETGKQIERLQCLLDALPGDEQTFGFMPALPMRMEDPKITSSIIRLRGQEYLAYYLTQFALAPRVIIFYDARPWIVANYPDRAAGLEAIGETSYKIVKDCENGVFLLKK